MPKSVRISKIRVQSKKYSVLTPDYPRRPSPPMLITEAFAIAYSLARCEKCWIGVLFIDFICLGLSFVSAFVTTKKNIKRV